MARTGLLLAPLAALALAGCGRAEISGQGFSAQAPDGWTQADPPASAPVGTANLVASYGESDTQGGRRANLVVTAAGPPPGAPLLTGAALRRRLRAAARRVDDDGRVRSRPTRLGGRPALRLELDRTFSGVRARQLLVVVQVEAKRILYTIAFTAPADRFAQLRPSFEGVLSSWRFKDAGS